MSSSVMEDPLVGELMFREWGKRFNRTGQYSKSIKYHEQSIKLGREYLLENLLGLSDSLKKAGRFKDAEEVAKASLKINPKNLRAYLRATEASYDVGEFAASLMYACRGKKRRNYFDRAVDLAVQTINDCVGKDAPQGVLLRLSPWIEKLGAHRKKLLVKADPPRELGKKDESLVDAETDGDAESKKKKAFKCNDPKARLRRHLARVDRMIGQVYLGPSTYNDKNFIENLIEKLGFKGPNVATSEKMRGLAEERSERLAAQQDAMRTRRPLYALKARAEAIKSLRGSRSAERHADLSERRCSVKRAAYASLRKLHRARLARDYRYFFSLLDVARDKLGSYEPRRFPQRDDYLDALYLMAARAYLDARDLRPYVCGGSGGGEDDGWRIYLRRSLGFKDAKLPRSSDVGWPKSMNVLGDLAKVRDRLALTDNPLETIWLLHEAGKLFAQIKRYELARSHAEKSRDLSVEWKYPEWTINACHSLTRIELTRNNYEEAREAAERSLRLSKELDRTVSGGAAHLVDFYERAVDLISRLELEDKEEKEKGKNNNNSNGNKEEDKTDARQRLIVRLMPDETSKIEMQNLVKAMDAQPPSRRLALLPGDRKKSEEEKGTLQRKGITRRVEREKLSVKGGKKREDYATVERRDLLKKVAPGKLPPGLVDYDQYEC